MVRRLALLLLVVSCDRSPPSASPATPTPEPEPAPAQKQEAKEPPKTTTTRMGGGRCEPMPKNGDPCAEGDSWCVISWGEPGGWSTALWCRGGRWEYEEEMNLPRDES